MSQTSAQALEFAWSYLLTALGPDKAKQVYDIGRDLGPEQGLRYYRAAITDLERLRKGETIERGSEMRNFGGKKHEPVSVQMFVEDQYFMDSKNVLFPKIMDCLIEMNNGQYQEAVLTGAIGTGKTTLALYSIAYQLYKLSCFRLPHYLFDLDPSSEILFIFQSLNAKLAKSVDFERFKAMIERSKYFEEEFNFDRSLLSEMKFPNRIIVKPVSWQETGAIGQNVIGGLIDEMNFMALIENSKATMDNSTFDQATALYDSIAMRRKSRFMKKGVLPGLLCLVSSKRYPGQFTDKKEEEANKEIQRTGKTSIYVYDKREWEVKPIDRFSGKWFTVFTGDEGRRPRIIEEDEHVHDKDRHLCMAIPEEYRSNFEADIMKALRDIAGVSTLAHHPFIVERDAIPDAMRKTGLIFGRETVDFRDTKLQIFKDQFVNLDAPRFCHCDLAISGDSAGFAVGHVSKFVTTEGGGLMPFVYVDALLEIKPPKGGEILLYKVREVVLALRDLGMNIKWVTFDQFQSSDSIQILRQQGFIVGNQSVDITTIPYDFTKSALYDRRLSLPQHKRCAMELASLEKDVKKNKIDHPPHGSKDVSDALAGVVYGLTMRRETWLNAGIGLGEIPDEVRLAFQKDKLKAAQPEDTPA